RREASAARAGAGADTDATAGGEDLEWPYQTSEACFFFSSRRRHTRSLRDWSSDVCSSDLLDIDRHKVASLGVSFDDLNKTLGIRSEERRVGKECRSRGGPYPYKKKRRTFRADSEQHDAYAGRGRVP